MNLSNITAAFKAAQESGVTKPKLKFISNRPSNEIVIYQAPDSGVNAGYLYAVELIDGVWDRRSNLYLGKINLSDSIYYSHKDIASDSDILYRLRSINADPLRQAQDYGDVTGACCACGRELTNPISVSLGIGPICRGYYGWGGEEPELPALESLEMDPELEAAFIKEAKHMAEAEAREEEIITVSLPRSDFHILESMILEYKEANDASSST